MSESIRSLIDEFLAKQRIAVIGVSRRPGHFSRRLFAEFRKRDYDVIPVNPGAEDIEGLRCYGRVQDIDPPVEGALLMVPPAELLRALVDCEMAGISRVWLYGINGPGGVADEAVEFCARRSISAVPGYCPFMFFPRPSLVHRAHGAILKLMGAYPA